MAYSGSTCTTWFLCKYKCDGPKSTYLLLLQRIPKDSLECGSGLCDSDTCAGAPHRIKVELHMSLSLSTSLYTKQPQALFWLFNLCCFFFPLHNILYSNIETPKHKQVYCYISCLLSLWATDEAKVAKEPPGCWHLSKVQSLSTRNLYEWNKSRKLTTYQMIYLMSFYQLTLLAKPQHFSSLNSFLNCDIRILAPDWTLLFVCFKKNLEIIGQEHSDTGKPESSGVIYIRHWPR